MKKITFLFLLVTVFAFAQQPQSFTELASTDFEINSAISNGTIVVNANRGGVATYTERTTWRAEYIANCGGAVLTEEDFEGSPVGVTSCGPIISSAGDGCFAAGEIVDGMDVQPSDVDNVVIAITAGIIGNTIPIVGANSFVDFTILNFSVDVYAVGMNIWNNFDPVTEYRIFDAGGLLLADFTLNNTVGAEDFFGFIAYEPISRVEIEEANDGSELFGWLEFGDCISLSVEDNLADLINIYPNPATTHINVDFPAGIEILDVALYDILGNNTGAVLVNGIIDVSNISRGVYILNVKTDQGTLTQKVIKR